MTRLRVMVVDDDASTCESLGKVLAGEGHDVSTHLAASEALDALHDSPVDVLVTDVVMSPMGGLELLARVVAEGLDTAVLLMTGYGDIPAAVEAVHTGAFDYLPKPLDVDRLCLQITKAGRQARLRRENRALKRELQHRGHRPQMIGKSAPIRDLRVATARAADSDATVLITGESGVGKELVARALYDQGPRADGPFVVVNCAAIPTTLVESEFFGHERGAFTGAVKRRRGRFELAHRGTLFLDEIGDIEPLVQVKLLRVLQERRFERVGGNDTLEVDVRIIAATRYDLATRVKEGAFREDLFYRLSVVHLPVLPLRERAEDIPLLVESFVAMMATQHGRSPVRIDREALGALSRYSWPGNIRELRNCIEGLVVMARDELIGVADLPAQIRGGGGEVDRGPLRTLASIERQAILWTLHRLGGNRRRAAEALGIGVKTLYRRLHDYGEIGGTDDELAEPNPNVSD